MAASRGKPGNVALSTLALGVALALGMAPPAAYAQGSAAVRINIPAQSLNQALLQLGQQTDIQIYYLPQTVQGLSAPAVAGMLTPDQALQKLLAGTGIEFRRNGNNISLSRPASSSVAQLSAVIVTGHAIDDGTTEGSGSYAASSATIAGKTAVPLQEIPGSVSVLTRQRMDDQNVTTIQQGLRYVTGVESVDYGDSTAYFKARGNQLGIEFDGVPIVNGLQYQPQFDLAMYDRVEVLRGPSGVMDGAGEPGGVVNLVRKRPQDQFHLSTQTQVGTFGSARQMIDVTGPLNQEGTVRGRAVVAGSDGLQSVDGTRNKNAMVYGALDSDLTPRTTLSLSGGYQRTRISGLDYGAPGVYDSTQTYLIGRVPSTYSRNFSPDWSWSDTSIAEANANLVHRFDNGWKWDTTTFYRHGQLNADYGYAGPGATPDGLSYYGDQRQHSTFDWFGADTHVSGPIQAFGMAHTLTVGANYSLMRDTEKYGFVALNGPYMDDTYSLYDPNAVPNVYVPFSSGENDRIEQYGVYAQARVHIAKPVTLVLGARETALQESTQPIIPAVGDWTTTAREKHRFLPSAGIVWDIAPWLTTYASYSKFLSAQTEATYTGSLLPPRTGDQYEVGVKSSFFGGRLTTTAALFRINDNNRAIEDPDHPDGYLPGGKARDQGFELEVAGQPTPNWNVYAGYTYLNVQYDNDTANLSDGTDPRHLFKLWTNYKFSKGMLRDVSVGGGMLAQSAITRGVAQGGYAIFNAQLGYRINKRTDVSLQLNNVFNRSYYVRPPGNFFSVFGDGRNAMLTLRYHM